MDSSNGCVNPPPPDSANPSRSQSGLMILSSDFDQEMNLLSPSLSPTVLGGSSYGSAPVQNLASICSAVRMSSPDGSVRHDLAVSDHPALEMESLQRQQLSTHRVGGCELLEAAKRGDVAAVVESLEAGGDMNASVNGLNALHLATKEGHSEVVSELLRRGIRVDATTKKRNTALHIACLAGQHEVARILLNNGAYVNSQSVNGFTPLYMAAQENHAELVNTLLCLGADQNLATDDGFTPIAVALQQGHKRIVEMLFENDSKSRVRLPALHIAAKKNDVQSASMLLEAAASKASANIAGASTTHKDDMQSQLVNCISKNGLTPLHIAAHYGHVEVAELLIRKSADINFVAQQSITPLHVAAKWGRDNMVRLLLHYNAHIDARTQDGLTPLHCAAKSGHENVVDTLLEHGAPITAKTKNGLTALHMAAQGDHDLSAKVLLSYKSSIIDHVTSDYLTALHVAAHCGNANLARLLLERGSNIDAAALNGFTPLHIACKKAHFALALLLLNAGANVQATTESGLTPLHVSSFVGATQISQLLIENGADCETRTVRGETPLHLACRANQIESLRCLIHTANADVNAGAVVEATETNPSSGDHQTPLHVATSLGFTKCMQFLLNNNAQINAMTKSGFTPLHLAAKQGNIEAATVLLEHGALPTINSCVKGQTGLSALHFASKYGHVKFVSFLLHRGAQPDIRGRNGLCPLHIAAHYDHANVALVLLRSGANPHSQALNGYTSLHIAARRGHLEITSVLLEYNAHVNTTSLAGFTPLHLACQFGQQDMVALLVDHRANVNCRSSNGLTPLHLCAQENHSKCGELLVKKGAIIDAQTKAGYTPLHVASHFGHLQIVKFVVHLEADIDSKTHHGYTAIHCAAQQNHLNIVRFLLEHRANPNAKSSFGQTALDIANRLGHSEIVEAIKSVASYVPSEPTDQPTDHQELDSDRSVRRKSLDHGKKSVPLVFGNSARQEKTDGSKRRRTESESALNRTDDSQSKTADDDDHANLIDFDFLRDLSFRPRDSFKPQQPEDVHEEQPLMDSSDEEEATNVVGGGGVKKFRNYKSLRSSKRDPKQCMRRSPQIIPNTLEDYLTRGADTSPALPGTKTPVHQSSIAAFATSMEAFDAGISLVGGDRGTANAEHMSSLLDNHHRGRRRVRRDSDDIDRIVLYGDDGTSAAAAGGDDDDDDAESGGDDRMTVASKIAPGAQTNLSSERRTKLGDLAHLQSLNTGGVFRSMDEQHQSHQSPKSGIGHKYTLRHHHQQQQQQPQQHSFLVSFIANAQGGKMIGSRHKNVKFIIPPKSASCPTRITCRFLRVPIPPLSAENGMMITLDSGLPNTRLASFDRTICPPLNDGEGLACGVIELNPVGYKFLGPVCLEVPHSAALHSGQREVVIFRSDTGDKWDEHISNHKVFMNPHPNEQDHEYSSTTTSQHSKRVTRIITQDLPRYFALVTRLAFDSYNVDESGRTISSTFVPKAMAVIPEKALIKPVKVSLQAIIVEPPTSAAASLKQQNAGYVPSPSTAAEQRLIVNFLGKASSLSPIVTIEPRRRKFHKPITIVIPLPSALTTKGVLAAGRTAADVRSLRLFCSITGGTHPAHWDDITGHTPLTLQHHDLTATFTSTVSARFWLVDAPDLIVARKPSEDGAKAASAATNQPQSSAIESTDESSTAEAVTQNINLVKQVHSLYRELMIVPYMVTVFVFAKTTAANIGGIRRSHSVRLGPYSEPKIGFGRCLTIRLMCLNDSWDIENLLENRENFVEISRSKEVELINGKPLIVEYCAEDSEQRTKKCTQYSMPFSAFAQNRLEFCVPEPAEGGPGVISMYQPRFGSDSQKNAFCHLSVQSPDRKMAGDAVTRSSGLLPRGRALSEHTLSHVARLIGDDWVHLAEHLGLSKAVIDSLRSPIVTFGDNNNESVEDHKSACFHQAFIMLTHWAAGPNANADTLRRGLMNIGRNSINNDLDQSFETNNLRKRMCDAGRHACCSEDDDDDNEDDSEESGTTHAAISQQTNDFINWSGPSTTRAGISFSTSRIDDECTMGSTVGGLVQATGRATQAFNDDDVEHVPRPDNASSSSPSNHQC